MEITGDVRWDGSWPFQTGTAGWLYGKLVSVVLDDVGITRKCSYERLERVPGHWKSPALTKGQTPIRSSVSAVAFF